MKNWLPFSFLLLSKLKSCRNGLFLLLQWNGIFCCSEDISFPVVNQQINTLRRYFSNFVGSCKNNLPSKHGPVNMGSKVDMTVLI